MGARTPVSSGNGPNAFMQCKMFFCFQGNNHIEKRKELTCEEIFKVLATLKQMGCYHIGFSGGEPFFRKDFLGILAEAKRLGFVVTFVSNMQLPSDSQIDLLADIGVDLITVSFHSIEPTKYAKIFGVSTDLYHRALRNIRHFIEESCHVCVVATISSENYSEMPEYIEFFRAEGIKSERINFNLLIQGENPISGFRMSEELLNILQSNPDIAARMIKKRRHHICAVLHAFLVPLLRMEM